jgi:hypothetical protein
MQAETETLTRLMHQAAEKGADLLSIRAIAEEASELGAGRALTRLGLADERARADIDELRELLGAWRVAKRSAWQAAMQWVVRSLSAALLVGIAVKLGLGDRFWA